jgi:hypothetical protein
VLAQKTIDLIFEKRPPKFMALYDAAVLEWRAYSGKGT